MLKKILVMVLFAILLAVECYAVSDPFISANTVSFNTAVRIVTFNSITNRIYLHNLSTKKDCHVDFVCRDTYGKPGRSDAVSANVVLPRVGSTTNSTVLFEFSTRNLGFRATEGSDGNSPDKVHYIVTGDREL